MIDPWAWRLLVNRVSRAGFENVTFLNQLLGLPSRYAGLPFATGAIRSVCFLDYNYLNRDRATGCLDALERLRKARGLDYSSMTLVLRAEGLDPRPEELLALTTRFREHHVFIELWNTLDEVVRLRRAELTNLYFLPVTAALALPWRRTGPPPRRPNRRIFVSLGGDDDIDLVRAVVRRRRDLTFFVPDVAWRKDGGKSDPFEVRIDGSNVRRVRCRPPSVSPFTLAYRAAYALCDTVLIATRQDLSRQMRGGIRVADALAARKHIVMTSNPMCELLMAQHDKTCLVAEHDAQVISEHFDRLFDGRYHVDGGLYSAIRSLTSIVDKSDWMMRAALNPEEARRSPFAMSPARIDERLGALPNRPSAMSGAQAEAAVFDLRLGEVFCVGGDEVRVRAIKREGDGMWWIDLALSNQRSLVVQLSIAQTARRFAVTSRGLSLSYAGTDITPTEARVLSYLTKRL